MLYVAVQYSDQFCFLKFDKKEETVLSFGLNIDTAEELSNILGSKSYDFIEYTEFLDIINDSLGHSIYKSLLRDTEKGDRMVWNIF